MKLLVALVVISAATLAAQQPGLLPEPTDMTPGEVQKIFDGYMISQAPDALGLTDQQFAQLVPRLKTLQDTRRRHQQAHNRLIGELQRLSNPRNPPADEAVLKDRLGALQELESRSAAEMRKAYNALDEVLDLRQQARFRVFEEQIERKKLDLLIRARQSPNRPNANRPLQKRPQE